MNFILAVPLPLRLAGLLLLGALVGAQLNRGIYRLACHPRLLSPWSSPPEAARRRWFDRIPILGWLALRRESALHGPGFWLRPMTIELGVAIGFAWLYDWETVRGGLVPLGPGHAALQQARYVLHAQYLVHVVLLSLLVVATFIDFDEQTIPDEITVPGTVLALVLAALLPASRLPLVLAEGGRSAVDHLWITSPSAWPSWLDQTGGLLCGWFCLLGWLWALLPKLWLPRRGLLKASEYFVAHILRPPRRTRSPDYVRPRRPDPMVLALLGMMLVGPIAIAGVWWCGQLWWKGLLSSLVGMAFGGGLIWAVRIIGTRALGKEAMGFGDVTFMAMIGAFLGWQPSLIIFFLAPFAALFIAVAQWLLTRRHDIAFGPYLSLATLILILRWPDLWRRAAPVFQMGWLVPAMVALCMVLMAAMLFGMRAVRELVSRGHRQAS